MAATLDPFAAYLPIDRRMAMVQSSEHALPSRDNGSVLFLDISGFTPLTQALIQAFGPDRGAEALIGHLNRVYERLIEVIHRYRGCVIGFSGDAITCWFSGDDVTRALTAALEAQAAMTAFADVQIGGDGTNDDRDAQHFALSIKVAISHGPVRRFLVGAAHLMHLEVLAGKTVDQVAEAEQEAQRREIVLTESAASMLGENLRPSLWRTSEHGRFAVIVPDGREGALQTPAEATGWPEPPEATQAEVAEAWLPMAARKRLRINAFLAEFRPVAALFLRFGGIDYDNDDGAGEALSAYIHWLQQIVARYGGTLLQLTFGDKGSYAYASFGAPVAYADNSVRAVAAALALLQPPPEFDNISPPQIGLASGSMCTGAYGSPVRRVYGVIGHKTNLAARLMMHAAPGSVLCDEAIQQAARATWAFRSLPSIQAKGVRGEVALFAPTGERIQSPSVLPLPKRRIGRDDVFSQMVSQLDAIGASESGVVMLEGEAGMGKSHLIGALAHVAQERDVGLFHGTGLSIEQHTPYRAWRAPLRALLALSSAGHDETETPVALTGDEQVHLLREYFEQHLPDEIERLPLLSAILDLPIPETGWTQELAPELRQESLQGLVISLLRSQAVQGPICLILEDAQWFDSLTWELLLQVSRAMEVSLDGLLLVLSTRPGGASASQAASAQVMEALSRHMAARLTLQPMPKGEIEALVAHELDCEPASIGPGVRRILHQRAGGNPFFALELLRLMREKDVLQLHEGVAGDRWTLRKGVDALAALPHSIEGLLLARIDQLPPQRQQILKVASAIGQSFPFSLLKHAMSAERSFREEDLLQQLTSLIEDAFAVQEGDDSLGEYSFSNIATRDVAYRTLLYQQRRGLHRQIALWYEQGEGSHPDDATEMTDIPTSHWPLLVYHWRHAQSPADERRWAEKSGELAASQYAHAEAIAHLSRALALTPTKHVEERLSLLLMREKVHERSGDVEAQKSDINALRAMAAEGGLSAKAEIEIRLREAHFAMLSAAYDDAIAAVADAHQQAASIGAPTLEAEALHLWGDIFFKQRKVADARPHFQSSLEVAQTHQLQGLEALSLNALGKCEWRSGNLEEGMTSLEQALALFRQQEDLRSEALVLNNIALVFGQRDQRSEAIKCLQDARTTCVTLGDRRGEALVLGNLGMHLMEKGAFPDAWSSLERGLVLSREVGARDNEALALLQLGDVSKRTGAYQNARVLINDALAIYEEIGHPFFPHVARLVLAECDLYTGEYEDAIATMKECLEAGVADMDPGLAAEMSVVQARAHEALEQPQEALDVLRRAAAWCEGGDPKIAIHHSAAMARTSLVLALQDDAKDIAEGLLSALISDSDDVIDGIVEPFALYVELWEVLHALEHPKTASLLDVASRLFAHRRNLLDEARQQAFVESVPHHQALVQLLDSGGS